MVNSLHGKIALVTGGSRGLGAAIARALAQQGADVAISYIASAEKAEHVVREIESFGVRGIAIKADQGDAAQSQILIDAVIAKFGFLDILVNNAGIVIPALIDDPNNDLAALERQYAINLTGVISNIRAAAKVMRENGRIITIGTNITNRVGRAGAADYVATKAAIVGYSKGAARDLAPRNITVNVVQPGILETDMSAPYAHLKEEFLSPLAIKRFGQPEEVASGVVFLASPQASYITGAVLDIDGGYGA